MTIGFHYQGPSPDLERRELLGRSIADHHAEVLRKRDTRKSTTPHDWLVTLGESLLFDESGLALIEKALESYRGEASTLRFYLDVDAALERDYYSLQPLKNRGPLGIQLALHATRAQGGTAGENDLALRLPSVPDEIVLPQSLGGTLSISVPRALLMNYTNEFDLLFANQMGILSQIARNVQTSPRAWIQGILPFQGKPFRERVALSFRDIHPRARVHPTAVIEGSIIGEGAEVGAHCTVRYSVIGPGARLYDGAKVEFSVVGARSMLMHDLVVVRCGVEAEVFLIHGPYQFSYFQRASSAFATILMDYRPDGKAIQVKTSTGLTPYRGRFLGSVLGEQSKLLGGCSLAPGRIVPPHTWLSADPSGIHTLEDAMPPRQIPLAPGAIKRRLDESIHH